jgi:hypothetical protein
MALRAAVITLALALAGTANAYCPASGNTGYEYIDQVTLGGTVITSGNDGGYADYSVPPIELIDTSVPIALGAGYQSGQYTEHWSVWIDLDQSGSFEPAERVFQGSGVGVVTGTLGIPAGTPAGETGLRVIMQYGAAATDPCASPSWGEVEDYAVIVPQSSGDGNSEAQTPWRDNAPGTARTGIAWPYVMGYHFTPEVDGQVTALGGLFGGTKLVRLFDRTSGATLAEVTVAAADDWAYADLATPVDVLAGEAYTVAVYLNGSGAAYHYPLAAPFPQTYGSVRIDGSTYAYTGSTGNTSVRPTNSVSTAMYGVADIRFVPGGSAIEPWSTTCTSDDTTALLQSGEITLGPTADIVPLCSGWVLVGDRSDQSVKLLNVADGTPEATYVLPGVPRDMDLDAANGWLYVALATAPGVAKVDLAAGTVTAIDVGFEAHSVAVGNDGTVFAVIQNGPAWWDRPIAILDGIGESVLDVHPPSAQAQGATLLDWDSYNGTLLLGDAGFSPSSLVRYAFDGIALTQTEYLWNAGSNGQDLAVSRDGLHLAFACGGGNGTGYTVFDYDPMSFASVAGEWNTGAYPRSAAFSPDSNAVAGSDGNEVFAFDVLTHVQTHAYTPPLAGCTYSQIERVRYSLGGDIVLGFSNCGFSDDSARLFWTLP